MPGVGNSSAYDRYAYTLNNPINFSDPAGHIFCDPDIESCPRGLVRYSSGQNTQQQSGVGQSSINSGETQAPNITDPEHTGVLLVCGFDDDSCNNVIINDLSEITGDIPFQDLIASFVSQGIQVR